MQALGMIEVYGYLAAVEALDSALKAANVSLADVVRVKGGLVTVLVTGEVGAVKAAMDASAAAAGRVGTITAVHVIPRPFDDVIRMLTKKTHPAKQPPLPVEVLHADQDVPDKKTEDLNQMTVAELRKLARETGLTGMTRQEIRDARKQDLISAILEWRRQES